MSRTILLAWCLCTVAVDVAWAQKSDTARKPVGSSLSELLAVLQSSARSIDRARAAEEISQYGQNAVGPLCELLRSEDESVRVNVLSALYRIGGEAEAAVGQLIEIAGDPKDPFRGQATMILGAIGPGAAAAAPALIEIALVETRELRQKALDSLASIGDPAALAALENAFQRGHPSLRWAVVQSLQDSPEATATLMPMLVAQYIRTESRLESSLLGLMGLVPECAVRCLIEALESERGELRRRVVMALCRPRLAAVAADAVPVLTEMLTDEDPVLRFWAVKALGEIGLPARRAAPALIARLSDSDADVRWQTIESIGQLGLTHQAAGELMRLRSDPHPAVRTAAEEWSQSLNGSAGRSS
jgi:HEAT repeat protein